MKFEIISQTYGRHPKLEPFSVAMTVKNESASIMNLLRSMFDQQVPPHEIVIVDGGSKDRTCELINTFRDSRINLIRIDGCSPAEGRNIAVKAARYNVLVMVDGGTTLGENLFADLLGPIEGADLVAGIYMPLKASKWASYFVPDWRDGNQLEQKFLPSCRNVALRRKLFDKVGGFATDKKQRWGEDTLFMMEAKKHSRKWVLNKKAVVYWHAPTTREEACQLAYSYGMGNGEVGCDYYTEWYKNSPDPVIQAAYSGYIKGLKLREAVA